MNDDKIKNIFENKRIREKLGDEIIIKTVRGLGYRIGE